MLSTEIAVECFDAVDPARRKDEFGAPGVKRLCQCLADPGAGAGDHYTHAVERASHWGRSIRTPLRFAATRSGALFGEGCEKALRSASRRNDPRSFLIFHRSTTDK